MRHQACFARLSVLLLLVAGVLGVCASAYAETKKFLATEGVERSFEAPAGVTTIQIVSVGGNGGEGNSACYGALGGHGAVLTATLHVTGGETLHVRFGGGGKGGGKERCAGGPGGGASELLAGETPLLVAGGGGGGSSGTPNDVIVCKDPKNPCTGGLGAAGGAGGSAQAGTPAGAGVLAGLSGANGAPALEEICEFNIETGTTCKSHVYELGGSGGGGGTSSPGNGGTGGCGAGSPGTLAAKGSPGTGGTGGTGTECTGGGGGGGGYAGGGGGAGGGYAAGGSSLLIGAGGGGAGSSYIDTERGLGSVSVNTTEPQQVAISYTVPKAVCTTNTGTITLSPGLTNTAAVQTMKIKGTLTGCAGESFTGAMYTATLKTAGPVSCPVLKGAGELASGAAKYKWTPKAKPSTTTGTLEMLLTETPSAALSGELTAGLFSPLTLSGKTSMTFTGGPTCGTKAVKKGNLTGTTVGFN